jgi:hypothetical protein
MAKRSLWVVTSLGLAAVIVLSVEGSVAASRNRLIATAWGWMPAQGATSEKPESRDAVISRARVWAPTEISSLNLFTGPDEPGAFKFGETVTCKYFQKQMSGRSPKFACMTESGEELKVKYGGANGEVYGEVMTSRLLWALGFPADRMFSVRVICQGCPAHIGGIVRENGDRVLDPAAIERKFPGDEMYPDWAWNELDQVDPESGGASRAERDALKLLAVFIQHSDSKPVQQRIVCPQGAGTKANCETPVMMINDLGITFGVANRMNLQPRGSVNLEEWKSLPVWRDATGCVGNLSGSFTGTLKYPVISEGGRKFLADLMTQLSDEQIRQMFEAARVALRPRAPHNGKSGFPAVDEWVTAFKAKRAQIVDRRCA